MLSRESKIPHNFVSRSGCAIVIDPDHGAFFRRKPVPSEPGSGFNRHALLNRFR